MMREPVHHPQTDPLALILRRDHKIEHLRIDCGIGECTEKRHELARFVVRGDHDIALRKRTPQPDCGIPRGRSPAEFHVKRRSRRRIH